MWFLGSSGNLKKILGKKIFFKLPELPRNHISRGGGCCHGQTDHQTDDITQWLVELLLASSKARLKRQSDLQNIGAFLQKMWTRTRTISTTTTTTKTAGWLDSSLNNLGFREVPLWLEANAGCKMTNTCDTGLLGVSFLNIDLRRLARQLLHLRVKTCEGSRGLHRFWPASTRKTTASFL